MITPILQLYPFFKGGLPLKSKDLNDLVSYLESEDRNTRTCLIGMGNMYGLRVFLKNIETDSTKPNNYVFAVKAGVGVTSLGYLMCFEEQIFTHYVETKVLTTDFQDTPVGVVLTGRGLSTTALTAENSIPVWELKTSFAASDKLLTLTDFTGKILVLLYQISGEVTDGCSLCDRTVNTNAVVRFLLINEKDYNVMEKGCPKVDLSAPKTTSFLKLQRLGIKETRVDWSSFTNAAALQAAYKTACLADISDISTKLKAAEAQFKPFFKDTEGGPVAWVFSVLDTLSDFMKENSLWSQYVHDYLRHLIRAFDEFMATPLATAVKGLAPKDCFPRHLALGKIDSVLIEKKEDGKIVQTVVMNEMATFRTPLYRPRFDDLDETAFQRSLFLYNRIGILLANSDFLGQNTEGDKIDIHITPSAARSARLGQQAIPYFLKSKEVKKTWQFNLTKTGRTDLIPVFDKDTNDSLLYQNVFDNADFYRIEGHIGKQLNKVWEDLTGNNDTTFGKRGDLNLPFSVEIVELTAATDATFTPLLEFIKQNRGLEHQGGVPRGGTFVLVAQRNRVVNTTDARSILTPNQMEELPHYTVVADFCLPYPVVEIPRELPVAYFVIDDSVEKGGKNTLRIAANQPILFINQSVHADAFEWFVDDERIKFGDSKDKDLTYTFVFDDDIETERTFVVTLVAKSVINSDLPPDMASRGVAITREKVNNPTALFKEKGRKADKEDSVIITFENASLHADTYEWFIDGVSILTDSSRANFVHTFNFDDAVETERTFVVTLVAKSENPRVSAATDSTSQGVVIKRTIAEKPIANFTITGRSILSLGEGKLKIGEAISFTSKPSIHALSFRWFVDDIEVSTTDDLKEHPFKFDDKDTVSTEKDFVVTLLAYNQEKQQGDVDVEKLTVSVRREIAPIIVDFKIGLPRLLQFDADNKVETVVTPNGQQITFVNLSKNADHYQWSIFLPNTPNPIDRKVIETEDSYGFNFTVREGQSTIYVVQLIAYDSKGKEVSPRVEKLVTVSFLPITADFDFNPLDAAVQFKGGTTAQLRTSQDAFSAKFINLSKNATKYQWAVIDKAANKLIQQADTETFGFNFPVNKQTPVTYQIQLTASDGTTNPSAQSIKFLTITFIQAENGLVDGLTASVNFEKRRSEFQQQIQAVGAANPPLSDSASFKGTVDFMANFDKAVKDFDLMGALEKVFDKLDKFDSDFKTLAFQLVEQIKTGGNIPVAASQTVLRNLLFFYLDKLTHLLPDALTASVQKTINDVLTGIKKGQSFAPKTLANLRDEWRVSVITTAQNEPVAKALNQLFDI